MPQMWTLGGLTIKDLLRRTCVDAWQDAVYGQAGRMAFYHFLAIFPCLLIFLSLARSMPSIGGGLTGTADDVVQQVLPTEAAALIHNMVWELQQRTPSGFQLLLTFAGALWAAMNGTWALVFGLNVAYEVEESRSWWRLGLTLFGLTIALAISGGAVLVLLFSAAHFTGVVLQHPSLAATRLLEWLAVLSLLMFSFALIFRFAPNLPDAKWKWSTPGSLCALILWVAVTVGLRIYFGRFNNYERVYGHLNTVVMVLLWLYFTNAAILIGGEMNSEIEKASADGGTRRHAQAQR